MANLITRNTPSSKGAFYSKVRAGMGIFISAFTARRAPEVRHVAASRPGSDGPKAQVSAYKRVEPNLVCSTALIPAHTEGGVLVEGHEDFRGGVDSNAFAFVAEISNEFDPTGAAGVLHGVSAQISYQRQDGHIIKVNRGSWLSESAYEVGFDAGGHHDLIIAAMAVGSGGSVYIFRRERRSTDVGIVSRIEFLEGDFYQVRLGLITESDGVVHKEFEFGLAITREPEFNVELVEGVQGEQAKRLVNARRIQEFIAEGNELLPKCARLSNPPYYKVEDWEERVMGYVKANFSEPRFLAFSSRAEMKPYRGAAVDRPLVDWINTLIERLGELLTELRNVLR